MHQINYISFFFLLSKDTKNVQLKHHSQLLSIVTSCNIHTDDISLPLSRSPSFPLFFHYCSYDLFDAIFIGHMVYYDEHCWTVHYYEYKFIFMFSPLNPNSFAPPNSHTLTTIWFDDFKAMEPLSWIYILTVVTSLRILYIDYFCFDIIFLRSGFSENGLWTIVSLEETKYVFMYTHLWHKGQNFGSMHSINYNEFDCYRTFLQPSLNICKIFRYVHLV